METGKAGPRRRHVPRGAAIAVVAVALVIAAGLIAWRWVAGSSTSRTPEQAFQNTVTDPGFTRKSVAQRREVIREIARQARGEAGSTAAGWDEATEIALRRFLGDFADEYARRYINASGRDAERIIEEFLDDVDALIAEMTGLPGNVARSMVDHMARGRAMASSESTPLSEQDRASAEAIVRVMEWVATSGQSMQEHARMGRFLRDVARHGQAG